MSYSALTLRYFETAPGAGVLDGAGILRGAAGSPAWGTWVQFNLQVSCGAIQAARFLAFACPHTIAVAAWVVEQAVGRDLQITLPEPVEALSKRFAVPIEKRGRLLIVEDAWRAAAGR
ncbi:MAG: iron-sulfur cluster assembly scaffold protein [Gammaproteobacteria bacterium]